MEIVLLVLVGVIGLLAFILLFVWNVVFGQSLRKMIMTFVGIAIDRGALVNPDAPADIRRDDPLSTEFERKAEMIKGQSVLTGQQEPAIPRAAIPETERGALAQETSDNGWPRVLDEETRGEPRAFRKLHLRTEYEASVSETTDPDSRSDDPISR